MTVSYSSKLGQNINLLKLLFRWNGSIYKLLWIEFLIFISLYASIAITKNFLIPKSGQKYFKQLCECALGISEAIPVAFVLAFFVRLVVNRSFDQFKSIPWIDKMALYLAAFVEGTSEQVVIMRRTIIRYMILSMTLCFRSISASAMKTFRTKDQLVNTGLVTMAEIERIDSVQFKYNRYFIPLIWATDMIRRADRRGRVSGERCVALLINEITAFHESLQSLYFYDWINIPLVYTQVSTICTYFYFICVAFGGQIFGMNLFIEFKKNTPSDDNLNANSTVDKFKKIEEFITYISAIPVFGIIQFFIYMGWLKVAEAMINPYGEDDEDFEMVALVERNLQIGYMIVDKVNNFPPKVIEDVVPIYLKADFQAASASHQKFFGSQINLDIGSHKEEGSSTKEHSLFRRSQLWVGTHLTKNPVENESHTSNPPA